MGRKDERKKARGLEAEVGQQQASIAMEATRIAAVAQAAAAEATRIAAVAQAAAAAATRTAAVRRGGPPRPLCYA